MPLIPRLHLFEIDDQPFVPSFVRARVQSGLTLFWTFRVPIIQALSPAALVSRLLHNLLGAKAAQYTYVDFCAGAGGPTPTIEAEFNALLQTKHLKTEIAAVPAPTATSPSSGSASGSTYGSTLVSNASSPSGFTATAGSAHGSTSTSTAAAAADFVLTDIAPHRAAWAQASARSAHIHFIPKPVDASSTSSDLLSLTTLSPLADASARQRLRNGKVFRLFFLAFHHMPDQLARRILADTLQNSEGFAIFELQGRSFGEFVMVLLLGPLLCVLAPFYFWQDPVMLLLTYVVPVVPLVLSFDGVVSCLRTRTGEEVTKLIEECGVETAGWSFREGVEWHSWPLGRVRWFVGSRE